MSRSIAVGVILNPMAGRDIRRVVSAASLASAADKVLTVRRILAGVQALPGTRVLMVDDDAGYGQLVARAFPEGFVTLLKDEDPDQWLSAQRTTAWARLLTAAGARVLVVVGGDGTQRNAAQAGVPVPLVPVAGGTNNVACWTGDQTVAGLAAARVAEGRLDPAEVGWRAKLLHVRTPSGVEEVALIDVALVRQPFTGALAVWHAGDVETLVLAVADPTRPGLSNIGGLVAPVGPEDEHGVWLDLDGPGQGRLRRDAVLAPGLLDTFWVRSHGTLPLDGERVLARRDGQGASVALDGERTVVLRPGEEARVRIRRDGPWIVDPARVMAVLRTERGVADAR
ncbi:Acetoin catabolism protein X [Candidatus Hydrogenisulfobacillus filiaventi]|uniref:Acetoin catabolism protein X n=1 Tax=Candidatus Hydrogenisulfobacillus filiaventi TaxID=2707344 RepID=A0A6F8ZE19_9FIRM|nr:Acetoin catabolism protein X [Candidatus Hydrogenisulfobacillus filiaventi]